MKKRIGFLMVNMLLTFVVVNAQTTYNWTGSVSNDYQVAGNWLSTAATPAARTSPANNDILQFNSSATVINVPTETIGQLILSGTAVVSLQPAQGYVSGVNAIRTLTIGNANTSDNDLQIPSGCELIIAANSYTSITLPATYGAGASDRDKISNALTIVLSSSTQKASIAGKLTIEREATFTLPSTPAALALTTYASTSYVYVNQNLYTVTAGTPTSISTLPASIFGTSQSLGGGSTLTYIGSLISGSITSGSQYSSFVNAYSVASGVTTVSGTIENKSASLTSVSAARLVFSSGSNYIYNRLDGNSNIPTGADMSGVNLTVQGINASAFTPVIPLPSTIQSLTWSTPNISGSAASRFSVASGTSLTISGNASFSNGTTTGTFGPNASSNVQSPSTVSITGNLTVACNFYTGRGTSSWSIGNLIINSGTLNVLDGLYNGSTAITSDLTVNGYVNINGTSIVRLNNLSSASGCTANLNVKGNLTVATGATLTTSSTSGQVGSAVFNGTTLQTFDYSGSVSNTPALTINNVNGVSITASSNKQLNIGNLVLTNGNLFTTTSFPLNMSGTYSGGSNLSYVSGPVRRASASTTPFTLPTGYGGAFRPITIAPQAPTSVTFEANPANTPTSTSLTGATSIDKITYYIVRHFTTATTVPARVKVDYGYVSGTVSNTSHLILASATTNGTWTALGGTPTNTGSITAGSIDYTTVTGNDLGITNANLLVVIGSTNAATDLISRDTYTWTGATSNDFQASTNWSPNRLTVSSTYQTLKFTSSATVTNVPSQTIGQLILSGSSTSVSLQTATGGTRTLTIGNGNISGTDLDIPSGCTLTLATGTASNDALTIAFTGTPTATIAGSLVINPSFTSEYINTYNSTNSTTTVSGTITNTGNITCTSTNMVFSTGGNYTHNRPDGSTTQSFPLADFTNANFTVQALVNATSTPTTFNNVPTNMASFTWNTPLVSGSGGIRLNSLVGNASTFTVNGNMSVTQGSIGSYFGFINNTVTAVNIGGNFNLDNASLNLCRGTMDWVVTGDFTMSSTSAVQVASNFYAGTTAITSSMTVRNFNQNGGTFTINNITSTSTGASVGILNVKGNFNQTAGTLTTTTTVSLSATNPGAQTGNVVFNGTSAQTFAVSGSITNPINLSINNSNGVTLNSAVSLPSTASLTLTNGLLTTTSTNLLTITNTATNAITGSSTAYVDGPLQRRLPQSLTTGSTYIFPVGKGGSYNPVELIDATTTSSVSLAEIRIEAFAASSGGSGNSGSLILNTNRYWQISKATNSTSFTNTKLRFTDAGYGAASLVAVGSALSATDFTSLGGSSINSPANTITSSSTTTIPNNFFGLATVTVYTWTGSTSNDFQVSTNWSPNRNSPSSISSDVLQFTSTPSGTVTNVPTQTIGQLLLSGSSTAVSLQAATGGSRTFTIGNGNITGTDLDIPTGCTLTLATGAASNDALAIAFSGTPTASIAGSLVINSSFTSEYVNTYIATNSTTTVSGTITNTGAITSTATNLIFSSGSTYIHNRPDGSVSQTFPVANFANANVTVQSLVNTSGSITTLFNNFPSTMASLTWNTPLVTGSAGSRWNIVSSGTSLTITGDVSITQGASNSGIGFLNSTANSVSIGGNLSVTTASLIVSRGAMNWNVTGDFTLNSNSTASVISDFYNGTTAVTGTMTVQNFIQNGGTFYLNNIANTSTGASIGNLIVKGNFTKTAGTFNTITTVSASATNSGAQIGNLVFNGTSAQTFTLNGGFTNSPNLTINNSNGVTIAGAGAAASVGTLTLTNGILSTSSALTVTNSISGGSSTAYVSGPLAITFPSAASNITRVYPIGKGGNYRPVSFLYNSVSGTSTVTVEQMESTITTGTLASPANPFSSRYWTISQSGGTSPNFNLTLDATGFSQSSGSTLRFIQTNGTTGNSYAVTGSAPNYSNSTALTSFLSGTNSFTIGENDLPTTITVSPLSAINYGTSSATLTATVSASNPGAGATVTFFVDGNSVGTSLTNASGIATLSYNPSSLTASTHIVTATVASFSYYGTSTSSNVNLTVNPTVPAAPESIVASTDNAQSLITFTAPSNNGGSTILDYTITAIPSSGSNIVRTGVTANPYTFTGLTNGTSYTFTVAARNTAGTGSTITSNAATPSSTTTWNGISWSATAPDASQSGVIAANLNTNNVTGSFSTCAGLTINAGVTFILNTNVTVNGAFVNNGTITGTGILILAGGSNQSISGNGIVNNITINNSNGVTVNSGNNSLGVSGILTLKSGQLTTNGNLTFKSTSIANTGTLATYGASGNNGTINGTVTVERYIPAGFRAYRDMASQLSGVGTIYDNWQEGGAFTSGKGLFITGPGAVNNSVGDYSAGQLSPASSGLDYSLNGNASIFTYNNANGIFNWNYGGTTNTYSAGAIPYGITNTKVALDPFVGYRVLVRGDRSFNLATTPIINYYKVGLRMVNPTVLRSIGGKLITGTVTYNTTNASGTTYDNAVISSTDAKLNNTVGAFSMVANPYVAPVQWGTGTNTNDANSTVYGASANINASYWFLNPTYGDAGTYAAYNALSGSVYAGSTTSAFIQPGQAFFVQTFAANPQVVFKETAKAVNSTKLAVFGATAPLSKIYISLLKKDTAATYSRVDGAAIAFNEGFTNEAYGSQDALKFSNANDNLYITDKGKNLSIDGRLPATAADKLPIAISKVSGTNYQLVVDATNYTSNGFAPYLVDSYRGTVSTLTNGTNTITFTVDANVAATYSNRFSIAFKPTTLAVNSIVASATLNNKIATISWNTVGEKGVSRFEVEKSTDAKAFTKIAQSTAKNTATASYSATDNSATATTSYYRIKAISEVGTVSYSNIVQLTVNSKQFTVYPNPLVGKTLYVSLANVADGNYKVTVTNVLGQKVQEVAINHAGGNGSHAIKVNGSIAVGSYNVTVRDANGKSVYQSSLVVQP